jgi:predicted amidohydrolase
LTDQSICPASEERETVRAAAIQLNSTDDRDRNLATADKLVRAAVRDGAELVVLPERWSLLGTVEQLAAGAEPLDGPAIAWARATARELAIELVAGSIAERRAGRERIANTSVHVGPDGEIRAVYRKLHLFDVEVGGTVYRESAGAEPGEEIVTSALAGDVGLGMAICYDLRFPELFRILALRGALVVTLPAAFTLATTRDHWEALLRARAIENQSFMVAPNQIGVSPPGNRCGGRSLIVDPWGLVLATAPDAECHVVADLDFERQREIRASLPSLAHRRPDAYTWPAEVED